MHSLKDKNASVTQIAINPCNYTLSSGHNDRYIRNWDIDVGKLVN